MEMRAILVAFLVFHLGVLTAFEHTSRSPRLFLRSSRWQQLREVGALNCVKKEYWSPIGGPDDFKDDADADLGMVDDSLSIGMGSDEAENGNSSAPEEYSESLAQLLKEAEENFKSFVDQMKGDRSEWEKPITQDDLREFRAQAGAGIQGMIDGDLNKALDCFDAARGANGTQVLLQRGMTLFFLGNYEEAASQFKHDVKCMENKNLKLFKATDARLWWSAALLALGRGEEAKDALDIYNDELEESRYLMIVLLRYYHGDVPLEELMHTIGNSDDRDVLGNNYYGNFYLALHMIASGEKDMAKTFLDLVCDSGKFDEKDLWRHLPGLLRGSLSKA